MPNRIQGTTGLVSLLGSPIKHSKSPHMHNSAFEKLGLDNVYLCFDTKNTKLEDAINSLKFLNAKGANITFPHKQEVLQYLDDISPDAKIIGAVNTIKIDPNTKKIKGYNSDGRGFIASLNELSIPFKNKKVVLCGSGGAAKAIAIQLAYEGVGEICIKARNKQTATQIKNTIDSNIKDAIVRIIEDDEDTLQKELKNTTLLVNATPLGMDGHKDQCIISSEKVLHKGVFVYDIVYEPKITLLMKYATKAGCKNINGENMLFWQGAIAFKIWFGLDMPLEHVREELFDR